MKQILHNESVAQILLHEITPGLRTIGYWLGETIGYAIDEVVDFITDEEQAYE